MTRHVFGSKDTNDKLFRLSEYLKAFSIALKDQGFGRIYIDAFAGTGDRTEYRPALPLFQENTEQLGEINTPGSARLAALIEPPLDTLVLIERDPARFVALEKLRAEFPNRTFNLHQGDANEAVAKICNRIRWHESYQSLRGFRGVVFLDPYGMEVAWSTVEAIAATEALDCWYFFPLSGLYRQAALDPLKIDESKRSALDKILGTTEWLDNWYGHTASPKTLFDDPATVVRTADVDAIEAFVKRRLESIFKGKVLPPLRLHHKNGAPLAALFFAVANPNPKAVALAERIAGHILRAGKSSHVRSK